MKKSRVENITNENIANLLSELKRHTAEDEKAQKVLLRRSRMTNLGTFATLIGIFSSMVGALIWAGRIDEKVSHNETVLEKHELRIDEISKDVQDIRLNEKILPAQMKKADS